MNVFIQQVINGLNSGSIYALVAIGYTMVYGILKLINFAHGEIMMFGAYFAFIAASIFWMAVSVSHRLFHDHHCRYGIFG